MRPASTCATCPRPAWISAAPSRDSSRYGRTLNACEGVGRRAPRRRNVSEPTLTAFLPDPAKATGAAVIVAPGGAFVMLSYDSEGALVARRLAEQGDVRELAAVSVDGKPVATAWRAPYRVDLTGKLHPGANRLEIKVVNVWVNRLVGDRQPGAVQRAYAPQSPYKADDPLRPSGLLGPVRVVAEDRR